MKKRKKIRVEFQNLSGKKGGGIFTSRIVWGEEFIEKEDQCTARSEEAATYDSKVGLQVWKVVRKRRGISARGLFVQTGDSVRLKKKKKKTYKTGVGEKWPFDGGRRKKAMKKGGGRGQMGSTPEMTQKGSGAAAG